MTLLHKISGRGLIAYFHDILMAGASFVVAVYLRLYGTNIRIDHEMLLTGTVAMALIGAGVFWFSGLYRGVWRYASVNDLFAIGRAVTLTVLLFTLVMFAWARLDDVPRAVPFINWLVLMALLGGPRFAYRLFKDRRIDLRDAGRNGGRIPVLLAGAGDAAELFIRSLRHEAEPAYRVVGIVSERPDRIGRRIHGIDVVASVSEVRQAVAALAARGERPRRLVITKEDMDGAVVRRLLDDATAAGMTLARLPRLTDFRAADGETPDVRPVDVEDLLGRPQIPLDRDAMRRLVEGRRVLVTGAGGSIGSELVRQIAGFAPDRLTMVENSEYALYLIDREMAEAAPGVTRAATIADVRDATRVRDLIGRERPHIVFHAAALKHVPLVEENPCEGLLTNVIGSRNVADACRAAGVAGMVQISTDKAVNPTSVMGASKRLAESYCQALDLAAGDGDGTRFVTVRFGNVLGSTGSVVPLFQRQLSRGGPLTVTHPEMTRYFMTVREAVELVLAASARGTADVATEGRIFVLDMGEPVKIIDLARQMIRLSGLEPDVDVKIEITGPRPGEKLFEEVFHGAEPPVPTDQPGLLLAAPRIADLAALTADLAKLEAVAHSGDAAGALALLRGLVPEYGDGEDERRAAGAAG